MYLVWEHKTGHCVQIELVNSSINIVSPFSLQRLYRLSQKLWYLYLSFWIQFGFDWIWQYLNLSFSRVHTHTLTSDLSSKLQGLDALDTVPVSTLFDFYYTGSSLIIFLGSHCESAEKCSSVWRTLFILKVTLTRAFLLTVFDFRSDRCAPRLQD